MEGELRYDIDQASQATIEKIRKVAREVWREIHQEGSLAREEAERAGIALSDVPQNMDEALSLAPSCAGFEPESVALIVTGMALHGAGRVSLDIWKYVLLPRIREKWGDHALKPHKAERKATSARMERPSAPARAVTKRARRKKAQRR